MARRVGKTTQFKKDLRRCEKRGLDLRELDDVVALLRKAAGLPEHYRDHPLRGPYLNFRDCHIRSDWVLIYKTTENDELILVRTGTHADLFE